jgi:hypothetical protein
MKAWATVLVCMVLAWQGFAQIPHKSIREIQEVPLDSLLVADTLQSSTTRYNLQASPLINDTVETTGICVVPKGVFGYNNAGWSILLYDTAAVPKWRGLWLRINTLGTDTAQAKLDGFDGVESGDVITVRGVVSEFPTNYLNSMTQLNYLPGKLIVTSGKQSVPPPVRLPVSTFYSGVYPGTVNFSSGEPYESMVVEFTDLVVPSYLNEPNGTFNMIQGSDQISSYDASDYYTKRRTNPPGWTYIMPPIGGKIDTIRGVMWVVSGGENPRGYRISPVYPGDLVVGSSYPLVQAAKRTPMVPKVADSVKVTVRAIPQPKGFPVDSVRLFYAINSGAFTSKRMALENLVDSTYSLMLPPQVDTTRVRYFYKVYDRQGNVVTLASYGSSGGNDTSKGFFQYQVLTRPLTIKDIQYTPSVNGYSLYATDSLTTGAVVTVSGIVTADTTDILFNQRSIVGGTYGWYLQSGNDPWSGIWIVGDSTMTALRRGDSVSVTGVVQEWISFSQGVTTRIANIQAPVVHSHGRPIPAPVVKTTGTFGPLAASGNRNAEPYEGMLVKFLNVKVTDIYPYFSDPTQYQIDDGTGPVWVHRDGTNTYTNVPGDTAVNPTWRLLKVGDKITELTGLIHFSVNRYKFVPRGNTDFGVVTGLGSSEGVKELPLAFELEQNYPNPFNPTTVVEYLLPTTSHVVVKVFNLLGQEVQTLVNGVEESGRHAVRFNGTQLASGIYLYRMTATGQDGNIVFSRVRKMVVLK